MGGAEAVGGEPVVGGEPGFGVALGFNDLVMLLGEAGSLVPNAKAATSREVRKEKADAV